jgi:peptidoglycan/xylan/chitin deacetylase (PgdA/CDA1 family)
MLKQIKRSVLSMSRRAGVFDMLRDSPWRQRRLLIVGYHGVSLDDEHCWDPKLYVTPTVLEDRFRLLRDGGYNVLSLGEGVARLRSGTLPPRSVALTFDDGTADFALKAYPLLRKYGFLATVYLTTYYSRFNRPVFGPFCSYLLWKSSRGNIRSTDLIPTLLAEEWDLRDPDQRERARRAITGYADDTGLSGAEKDALARRLAGILGVDYEDLVARRILCLMTPDEVQRLSAEGTDFQLHTHRHRTPVDEVAFAREIDDNRRDLTSMTGQTPSHFCYPSGVYEPEFFPWLRDAGVVSATTCDTGIASASTDPLLLPRLIDTMNLSNIEFESWLTGAGNFLPLRPHQTHH